jgi:hypothetical protein
VSKCLLPSPDDGNRSSFRKVVFYLLEYRTMEKDQIPSNSVKHILFYYSNMLMVIYGSEHVRGSHVGFTCPLLRTQFTNIPLRR